MSSEEYDIHQVDQGLAEAIELGHIRTVGDDQYQLTAKGATYTAMLVIGALIETADAEKRDFTAEERWQVLSHLKTVQKALDAGEEGAS